MFSPFYARARAAGGGVADPLDFCALNVCVYGAGEQRWALTERGRDDVRRDASTLAIGPSTVRWDGDALVVRFDERTAPFGRRVRGTVRLHPEAEGTPRALDGGGAHTWWPVAPIARVEVSLDDPAIRWRGTGYHDANHGDAALERDFHAWSWSRSEGPSGATLLYDVSPRDGARAVVARRFDRRGGVEELPAPPVAPLGTSRWGIARETRCDARRAPELVRPLEDTPFYARSLVRTSVAGERVVGVHEQLSLDRFERRWVQFLLPFKMRRA